MITSLKDNGENWLVNGNMSVPKNSTGAMVDDVNEYIANGGVVEPYTLDTTSERRAEILTRLSAIDIESVRPLRAIANGKATQFDTDKLSMLDAEAETLRTELASL